MSAFLLGPGLKKFIQILGDSFLLLLLLFFFVVVFFFFFFFFFVVVVVVVVFFHLHSALSIIIQGNAKSTVSSYQFVLYSSTINNCKTN